MQSKYKISIHTAADVFYQKKYSSILEQNREYCINNKYNFKVHSIPDENNWPKTIPLKAYNKNKLAYGWIKIPLIEKELKDKKSDIIVWIDSDAVFTKTAEKVCSVINDNDFLYMVKGKSKRFNSGFMIIKNCKKSISFFNEIHKNSFLSFNDMIPGPALSYENAAIIYYSSLKKYSDNIKEISLDWNNTINTSEKSNVIHFTGKNRGKENTFYS